MKKAFFIATFFATMLTSCIDMGERVNGSGNIKMENRDVRDTRKIKVMGDMEVYIDAGSPSVKVEADDNLLQYIEVSNNDGWLEIKHRENFNLQSSKPTKVYVTTPEITNLKISGSGNVIGRHKFSTNEKTSFDITGSGNMTITINSPEVDANISGSGNLRISGETKDVEINVSGSGNYDGDGLKAENATVSIAGSGDADLFADNKLKASVAGSGNVKYKGGATVDSHIAGSGTVMKAE